LLVNDPALAKRAEIVWEKGTNRRQHFRGEVDKYTWLDLGSSFLPSDIIAAFLYAQFEQAEAIIARRCTVFSRYLTALAPLARAGLLGLPPAGLSRSCNAHIFYLVAASLDERTRLIRHLAGRGVSSVFHYVPLHSSPAGLKFARVATPMAVTDAMSERILRLPLYYEISDAEVDAVVEGIFSFYGQKP